MEAAARFGGRFVLPVARPVFSTIMRNWQEDIEQCLARGNTVLINLCGMLHLALLGDMVNKTEYDTLCP